MVMFAGRWAIADPTAAARARVWKNMLAIVFKTQKSMEVYLLWLMRAGEPNVDASGC